MDRETSREVARQGHISVQKAEGFSGVEEQRDQVAATGSTNGDLRRSEIHR